MEICEVVLGKVGFDPLVAENPRFERGHRRVSPARAVWILVSDCGKAPLLPQIIRRRKAPDRRANDARIEVGEIVHVHEGRQETHAEILVGGSGGLFWRSPLLRIPPGFRLLRFARNFIGPALLPFDEFRIHRGRPLAERRR